MSLLAAASLLLATTAAAMDHSAWDALLRQHVNAEHLVDYQKLKAQDLPKLDAYLQDLAQPWPKDLSGDAEKAALINAYNALTIRWVLQHYPVVSIWKTKQPFREARHKLNGELISLDALETKLRKSGDVRIHAALVCAARSCPPLRREAYTAEQVSRQLDDNTRQWLANTRLNSFDPQSRKAEVSMIFKWYRTDFPDLQRFFKDYAPWKQEPEKISHKTYHWGLNDSSGLGADYSTGLGFWFDAARNR
jgi:hypothetical protein